MADPTNQVNYYFDEIGSQQIQPIICMVRATFTAAGTTWAVSSTRRQSHQCTIVDAGTGVHNITGLPAGQDYHIIGATLVLPGTTQAVNDVDVSAFNAGAGTATFKTRTGSTGAAADPADGTVVMLTILVEVGAFV